MNPLGALAQLVLVVLLAFVAAFTFVLLIAVLVVATIASLPVPRLRRRPKRRTEKQLLADWCEGVDLELLRMHDIEERSS